MPAPDALISGVPDIFWKKVGRTGWLYNGSVVFSAIAKVVQAVTEAKIDHFLPSWP